MMRNDFLPVSKPDISKEEIEAVREVIESGWWTTGPKTQEFEGKAVEYLSENNELYSVGLNSCTSGLFLSLLALGIKAGDEVIVPTWTFAATAQVVEWAGAEAVLCDIENDSLNIDVSKAQQLITSRTKAIIPVHIAGYPCDMEGIERLALEYGLKVVEDAAHAFGAKYRNKKIGNFSDVTVFSFYATKNLAMGEGGMVVSRDRQIIDKIRKKSYFGINKEAFRRYEKAGNWFYDIEELGYKCNLDSIHASIGLAQLKRIDRMIARRREIARLYRQRLTGSVDFTRDSEENFHTYHLFPVKLINNKVGRDELMAELKKRNIGTSVHYIPLHMHTYYRKSSPEINFPVANSIFHNILSLPMFSAMSDEDVDYVSDNLKQVISRG